MTFLIAPAQSDHMPHVARIWHQGWHDAHDNIVPEALYRLRTEETFHTRVTDKVPDTLVALVDHQVTGFVMLKEDELHQLYVAPKGRGTGMARALVMAAETRLLSSGHSDVWLACAIGNTRAMRFYEKCGWTNQGRNPVVLETQEGPFTLEIWRFEKRLG